MNKRMIILLVILAGLLFRLGLEIGNDRADDLKWRIAWTQIEHQAELYDYYAAWKQCNDQLPKGETE